MENAVAQIQRIGLKFFLEDTASLQPRELVSVFHRWIQTHAVDGLLIDVANYEHVLEGPAIMLVAHEGNYCLDIAAGRMGMLYTRKQPVDGSLPERLTLLCRIVLKASHLLEEEPSLGGRVRVRGDELELVANDRLLAPNTEETLAAFRPALGELLGNLYTGAECEIARNPDPRERFTLAIKAEGPVPIQTLLQRVGG